MFWIVLTFYVPIFLFYEFHKTKIFIANLLSKYPDMFLEASMKTEQLKSKFADA